MTNQSDRGQSADNAERTEQGDSLVKIILENYWSPEQIAAGFGFHHEPNGYEHLVTAEERLELRHRYDEEAFNVRFRPDALVLSGAGEGGSHIFLEYKATTTPRYSFGDLQWDRGQIEADPWENYLWRVRDGQRLAILNYCSFHSMPLLCDYPTPQWQVGGRRPVAHTRTGSRTDYYNTDLRLLRTFEQFMLDEFGIPLEVSLPLIRNALRAILDEPLLQTRHDGGSRLYRSRQHYRTGFNWEQCYQPT